MVDDVDFFFRNAIQSDEVPLGRFGDRNEAGCVADDSVSFPLDGPLVKQLLRNHVMQGDDDWPFSDAAPPVHAVVVRAGQMQDVEIEKTKQSVELGAVSSFGRWIEWKGDIGQ